jgi:2-keto-3-deoxy-6-phosphogluconate aldolase
VSRALGLQTSHPLASVVRLLAWNALVGAGAVLSAEARRQQQEDLAWIGETLGGRPG